MRVGLGRRRGGLLRRGGRGGGGWGMGGGEHWKGGRRGAGRERPSSMKKKMNKEIMLGAFASHTRGMGTIRSVAKFNNVDSASLLERAQSRLRDGRIWGLEEGLKGGKAGVG